MLFSLSAAQRELHLRHYDVKLLNYFLSSAALPASAAASRLALVYGTGAV